MNTLYISSLLICWYAHVYAHTHILMHHWQSEPKFLSCIHSTLSNWVSVYLFFLCSIYKSKINFIPTQRSIILRLYLPRKKRTRWSRHSNSTLIPSILSRALKTPKTTLPDSHSNIIYTPPVQSNSSIMLNYHKLTLLALRPKLV